MPTHAPRPTPPAPPERLLRDYLGLVRAHLPVGSGGDILRELESSILDRADALADRRGSAVDETVLRDALAEVGEPEDVAASFVPRGHVVAPEHYRSFLIWTALALAVHLVLLGIASATERGIRFGPLAVAPVGPHGFWSLGASVLHAVLLDVGLTVAVFATAPRVRTFLQPRTRSFGVDAAPRSAGGRAILALLVGAVLVFFRDRLFVVLDGTQAHPLFTPWFVAAVPLLVALLGFSTIVNVLYLAVGERRTSLALDAAHGALVLAVMVHLARGEALLEVPPIAAFDSFRAPINGFLDNLGALVVLFIAALSAVKTVRRLLRFSQL